MQSWQALQMIAVNRPYLPSSSVFREALIRPWQPALPLKPSGRQRDRTGDAKPPFFPASIDGALHTAQALGLEHHLHSIDTMHESVESVLDIVLANSHPVAGDLSPPSRILVMGYANVFQHGDHHRASREIAQGYCTLYGDMAKGYAPLGDVYKMDVYAMAEHFNQRAIAEGRIGPFPLQP